MSNFLITSSKRLVSASLALLAAIVLMPCAAHATPYVVRLVQQGSNVVAVGSGSFDLSGLTFYSSAGSVPGAVWPAPGYVYIGGALTGLDAYTGFSGPASFGSGGAIYAATTVSGDAVAIYASDDYYGFPLLFVPTGYVSGTTLLSGAAWDNASFASLGVTPGTYTWTWGTGAEQSFTLTTASAVPEPAALGMFGLGLLLVGGFVTLRRRGQRLTV